MSAHMLRGINTGQFAAVDFTGGLPQVIQLTSSDKKKVLLRLEREGVAGEMELSPQEAEQFIARLREVWEWAR